MAKDSEMHSLNKFAGNTLGPIAGLALYDSL